MKFASKLAHGFWRRMKVCGSYACTCNGGCGDATQSSAPTFQCAGREPATSSARAGNANNNIAANVSSVAILDGETKRRNLTVRIGSVQRFRQKDCAACIFLQRVTRKTGSLVCTQRSLVIIHDFKSQLAATEFTGFAFDGLQQTPSDVLAAK